MTGQATTQAQAEQAGYASATRAGTSGGDRPVTARTQAPAGQTQQPTRSATSYQRTFYGRADQVSQVRREIAGYLGDCPVTDDMVLIADELAANAILHTHSRGSTFHVRCQLTPSTARIEVEDMGGPWRHRRPDDRPHGLDIVQALAGPDGWGTQADDDGNRIVWARLSWQAGA